MNIFQELQKRGYFITQKSVITQVNYNPDYEIPREDLIQELALVVDWLSYYHEIIIIVGIQFERETDLYGDERDKEFFEYIYWIKDLKKMRRNEEDFLPKIADGMDDFYRKQYENNEDVFTRPHEATIAAIEYLIENKLI